MQLTGKQIVENGIMENVDPSSIQQQGIDVRLKDVRLVTPHSSTISTIFKNRPTCLPQSILLEPDKDEEGEFYIFQPGKYYDLEFYESLQLGAGYASYLKARSSLIRMGGEVYSGQYDAGFKTDNIGCFLKTLFPIKIYRGARVAQMIVNETYLVDTNVLYNGQWQQDIQRNV